MALEGREAAQGRKGPSSGEATASGSDAARGSSGRGRPASSELDARQLQAIALFIENPNKSAVAAKVGVSSKTLTRWFQTSPFVDEYRNQIGGVQLELWAEMVGTKDEAWTRFKELMADPDPRIALRATTWFLDRFLTSPPFLPRTGARDAGIDADLERRERELLGLVGAIGRSDSDGAGADGSNHGREASDDGQDHGDGAGGGRP